MNSMDTMVVQPADDEENAPSGWFEDEEEADTDEEEDITDLDTQRRIAWVKENVHDPSRIGNEQRTQFLCKAELEPPKVLRVIDVEATCSRGHVTLVDYRCHQVYACGYSAISHTYGLEVYSIFDCQCASLFEQIKESIPPRCWGRPCPHLVDGELKERRDRVVGDILQMSLILSKAGVSYAWHDGVCIAQHDENEVRETIQSMGWIYSTANETIIFLHYVGKPMAPISPRDSGYDLVSRWHTRVWTLQEAALSKRRRFCVRVCKHPVRFRNFYRSCRTLTKLVRKMKEFEEAIALWYSTDTSDVDVITEEMFMVDFIREAEDVACQLRLAAQRLKEKQTMWNAANTALGLEEWYASIRSWYSCMTRLKETLRRTCLEFPTLGAALATCSRRDSKHMGDRLNSVLTLAGLKNFVAPKDFLESNNTMELWTIDFFRQQGQEGLAWALFSINVGLIKDNEDMQNDITCTWVPLLWKPLREPDIAEISKYLKSWGVTLSICEDNRLRLEGEVVCVALTFTLKLKEGEGISTTEHVTYDESLDNALIDVDLLMDEMNAVGESFEEDYRNVDDNSFGGNHLEGEADFLHDEAYIEDGSCTEGQDSEVEEKSESNGEGDEEIDVEELEAIAKHVMGRERLSLELNITVEGFFNDFLIRFLDTSIIMGAATFFPVQRTEGIDGCRIGPIDIDEGQSFHAYLVAPLCNDKEVECLVVEGDLRGHVSKIGMLKMFTRLTRIFQTEEGKVIDHPAYQIMEGLVIY